MNLLYEENLFTSFGHLPVTENAETGSCQLWQFRELPKLAVPGVTKVGSSRICQLWQFRELPKLATSGRTGTCQKWHLNIAPWTPRTPVVQL